MEEKNYKNESMVDVAYDLLEKTGKILSFSDLFKLVADELELTTEQRDNSISQLYTNLSLDGRFVNLGDNTWDLRENQAYDKVHISMQDVYSDIEEETKGNLDIEEYDEEERAAEGIDEDLETEDDGGVDYDRSPKRDL